MSKKKKPTGKTIRIDTMPVCQYCGKSFWGPPRPNPICVPCVYTKVLHGPFQHAAMEWTDDGENTITGQHVTFINNPKQR